MNKQKYLLQYSTYDYYNKYINETGTAYDNDIINAYNEYKQTKDNNNEK